MVGRPIAQLTASLGKIASLVEDDRRAAFVRREDEDIRIELEKVDFWVSVVRNLGSECIVQLGSQEGSEGFTWTWRSELW